MRKIFYLTILSLFISSISYSGCTTPGLDWRHLTTSWGNNFSPYAQPPGYLLIYAWLGAGTKGRIDSFRGTGQCGNYGVIILDWYGYGYTDYAWWNFGTCSTLVSCIETTDYMVLVAYNQINDGTANHQTKWIVDHCNRVSNTFNFDDSNGVGQNMFELSALNITNATKVSGSCTAADPCTIDVTVSIPTIGGVYGDGSINPRTNTLAGAVIMMKQSASAPTTGNETSWLPVLDPENDQYFNFSELGGVTTKTLRISGITSSDNIYLSYKPILQYSGACATPTTCSAVELSALDAAGFDIGYVTSNSPPIVPTPVTISSFTARYTDLQNVQIDWETASETNALGFFLYRSLDGQNWTKINQNIIPAKGQGGAGATYTYNDQVPKQRTYTKYYYKLEEISNNGERIAEVTTETIR